VADVNGLPKFTATCWLRYKEDARRISARFTSRWRIPSHRFRLLSRLAFQSPPALNHRRLKRMMACRHRTHHLGTYMEQSLLPALRIGWDDDAD